MDLPPDVLWPPIPILQHASTAVWQSWQLSAARDARFSNKSAFGNGGDTRVREPKRKQRACFVLETLWIDPPHFVELMIGQPKRA